jgi:ribonuclease R
LTADRTGHSESFRGKILEFLARYPREQFKSKELARRMGIRSEKDYRRFKEDLRALQDDREILRIRGKKYSHLHAPEMITGTLEVTTRGLGFLSPGDDQERISIRPENLAGAMHGDLVEVSVLPQSTKRRERAAQREGEVLRVIERGTRTTVGTLERARKQFFVVPDDKRLAREILIPKGNLHDAAEGDKVVVEVLSWGGHSDNPEGKITRVLGKKGELSAEIQSVVHEFHLPVAFPEDVMAEAEAIPPGIPHSEIDRRTDLRDVLCFTIDPHDAKDFDDAVSLERMPGGNFRLGVHIADVSYYVKEGAALDLEALKRGTSVYFPNGVIPMLPEKLSNDLCSLRPREDRLAFSVLINISPRGSVKGYEIRESVICSKRRFSYEEVQTLIGRAENHDSVEEKDEPFTEALREMRMLANTLTKKRLQEGSIDFDSAEAKFEFDEKGRPTKILKKVRLESHRLVEEFMLLANRVVASHVGLAKSEEHPKPFLYRVHDSPDPERIRELSMFVQKFGFKLNVDGGVPSKSLQRLLEQVRGTEVENVINEVALRSMAKAIYSERNIGHYGLAFDYYAHFTSPIRRYPDLVVHRMLKQYSSGITRQARETLRRKLPSIAKQSSEMERRAMEAERAAIKVMQVEYMKRHVGDEFHAVISGVTNFGLFVEITDTLVEGMIHVRDLRDDYYVYDEKQYALTGRRRGKQYRLGDGLKVQVVRVDPEERRIDFQLADSDDKESGRKYRREVHG